MLFGITKRGNQLIFPPKDYNFGVLKSNARHLYLYADVCGKYLGGGLLRDTAGSRNTGSGRRVTYTHGVDIAARCWGIFWRGGGVYLHKRLAWPGFGFYLAQGPAQGPEWAVVKASPGCGKGKGV